MQKTSTIAKAMVRKRKAIAAKQRKLYEQLTELQTTICPHPNLRYRNQGSTGSWDRDDSYWIEWFCPDCVKRWSSKQNNEERSKHPHAHEVSPYRERELYDNFDKPND